MLKGRKWTKKTVGLANFFVKNEENLHKSSLGKIVQIFYDERWMKMFPPLIELQFTA